MGASGSETRWCSVTSCNKMFQFGYRWSSRVFFSVSDGLLLQLISLSFSPLIQLCFTYIYSPHNVSRGGRKASPKSLKTILFSCLTLFTDGRGNRVCVSFTDSNPVSFLGSYKLNKLNFLKLIYINTTMWSGNSIRTKQNPPLSLYVNPRTLNMTIYTLTTQV